MHENYVERDIEKGPLRFRPLPKEDGCRFHGHKPLGVKATVGKVIYMMNLPFLSPKTIARIARGSVSLEQHYFSYNYGRSNRYRVKVAYPNGYDASITFIPGCQEDEKWDVALLKDGELLVEDDGYDYTWSNLTEADVIEICDYIYFK